MADDPKKNDSAGQNKKDDVSAKDQKSPPKLVQRREGVPDPRTGNPNWVGFGDSEKKKKND